jgi:hypothetical protein
MDSGDEAAIGRDSFSTDRPRFSDRFDNLGSFVAEAGDYFCG